LPPSFAPVTIVGSRTGISATSVSGSQASDRIALEFDQSSDVGEDALAVIVRGEIKLWGDFERPFESGRAIDLREVEAAPGGEGRS
jgi:hypothetical protein